MHIPILFLRPKWITECKAHISQEQSSQKTVQSKYYFIILCIRASFFFSWQLSHTPRRPLQGIWQHKSCMFDLLQTTLSAHFYFCYLSVALSGHIKGLLTAWTLRFTVKVASMTWYLCLPASSITHMLCLLVLCDSRDRKSSRFDRFWNAST